MMYAVRQARGRAFVPRSLEARSGLRDLLLGRGVGVGLVPQRADERRGGAARVRGGPEGDLRSKSHADAKERALIDAMSVRYVEKFDAAQARRAGSRRTPRRCASVADGIRTISTSPRSTPTRCSCSSRGAARATSTIRTSSGCTTCSSGCSRRTSTIPAPAISTCTRPNRPSCPDGPRRAPSSWASRFPGASHINHMPSHTWNEVGRWGDSVRANLEAWHSDLKAAIGEGFAIYPEHNLHMLLFAASMDGQGAIAMQAGKDYAKLTGDTLLSRADARPVRPLRRSARGHEPSDATRSRAASGISRRATRTCKQGDADFAKRLPRARAEDGRDVEGVVPRATRAKNLLGIVAGILEGEILRAARRPERRHRGIRARRRRSRMR